MSESIKPSKSGTYIDVDTWDALKAAGFSDADLEEDQPEGPMICGYSRAEAIEDGMLVDLCGDETCKKLVKEAGIKVHAAMTATAWGEAVCPIGQELPAGQSLVGRLWDVLMMFHFSLQAQHRKGVNSDRVHFKILVDDGTGRKREVAMYCQCGPGDDAEPVLTFMLEGED